MADHLSELLHPVTDATWDEMLDHGFYRQLPSRLAPLLAAVDAGEVITQIALGAEELIEETRAWVSLVSRVELWAALDEPPQVPASPRARVTHTGHECQLEVPLAARGVQFGGLWLARQAPRRFSEQERRHARVYTELSAAILHGALTHEQLRALARTDHLTGAPNRRALIEEMARRHGGVVRLAMLDVDGLKRVNDQLGYRAGNALICALSAALERARDEGVVSYRLAGDEFVCLLPQCDDHTAELFRGLLVRHVERLGIAPEIATRIGGVSVGLCSGSPGEAPDDLLDRAEQSMRETKRRRKGERPAELAPAVHHVTEASARLF